MRRTASFSLIAVAAMLVSACGGGRPVHYYTLELPPPPQPAADSYPVTLLIGRINAPEILQDGPIVYRSGRNEIGVYQYHRWAEPPVEIVRDRLVRELRDSGKYQSVDELGSSARGDYVLYGKLYDFEEVDTASITALVSMSFELLDRRTGRTVWTHYYAHSTAVEGKEIPDVVSALDTNLAQGLTEIAAGLDAYFSANRHTKS